MEKLFSFQSKVAARIWLKAYVSVQQKVQVLKGCLCSPGVRSVLVLPK